MARRLAHDFDFTLRPLVGMDRLAERLSFEQASKQRPGSCTTLLSARHAVVFQHAPLLHEVLAHLPKQDLLRAASVSKAFQSAAQRVLVLDGVKLDSTRCLEAFQRVVQANSRFAHSVRTFHVTRTATPLLETLPALLPGLHTLVINAQVQVDPHSLASAVVHLRQLRQLSITGQDTRSRRRRLLQTEPEGTIGQALRQVAQQGGPRLRLKSLVILSTPLKLSSIDEFLRVHGRDLEKLELDGCSLGPLALEIIADWCPNLRSCVIDTLIPSFAPPSTPRPNLPPLDFDGSRSLGLSQRLTTLSLSSLPSLAPSAFELFSSPSYSSLRTLSVSHSDITAFHLSHFAYLTKLKLVACTNVKAIPVFPAQSGVDIGPGCKELQHLSVLGRTGIKLRNLWELAMLGLESLSPDQEAQRREMGYGPRGLIRLTIDGAQTREQFFNIEGLAFQMPRGLGARPPAHELPSTLPEALQPPRELLPLLHRNVLSSTVPSFALLSTLAMANRLEQVSLFGSVDPSPYVDPSLPAPDDEHMWTLKPSWAGKLKQRLLSLVTDWSFVQSYLGSAQLAETNPVVTEQQEEADQDEMQSKPATKGVAQARFLDLPPLPSLTRPIGPVAAETAHQTTRFDIVNGQLATSRSPLGLRGPRLSKEEIQWLLKANQGVLKSVRV
ncbi:hypothetical protein OIV83_002453 [Microbotryomycetes sp. JL201]|nr:hypothetical protein OIV83_002453 [Microbotryomycetes sp. JL201]